MFVIYQFNMYIYNVNVFYKEVYVLLIFFCFSLFMIVVIWLFKKYVVFLQVKCLYILSLLY